MGRVGVRDVEKLADDIQQRTDFLNVNIVRSFEAIEPETWIDLVVYYFKIKDGIPIDEVRGDIQDIVHDKIKECYQDYLDDRYDEDEWRDGVATITYHDFESYAIFTVAIKEALR